MRWSPRRRGIIEHRRPPRATITTGAPPPTSADRSTRCNLGKTRDSSSVSTQKLTQSSTRSCRITPRSPMRCHTESRAGRWPLARGIISGSALGLRDHREVCGGCSRTTHGDASYPSRTGSSSQCVADRLAPRSVAWTTDHRAGVARSHQSGTSSQV